MLCADGIVNKVESNGDTIGASDKSPSSSESGTTPSEKGCARIPTRTWRLLGLILARPPCAKASRVAEGTCLRILCINRSLVSEVAASPMRTISRCAPITEACGSTSIHGLSATRRGSSHRVRLPLNTAASTLRSRTRVSSASAHGSSEATSHRE
eukprot:scaffold291560_cov31-Tisochrysis_lutea.AAC.1